MENLKIGSGLLKASDEVKKFKILITGAAGFIGSNLLEFFLKNGFEVVGIDNFVTGFQKNIDDAVQNAATNNSKIKFNFIKGDVRKYPDCVKATKDIDVVYHEAALGSVQRSIDKPLDSNEANVNGTMNLLRASVENNVKRFIFASSSSVYGDSEILPKQEDMNPNPKSIYAISKLSAEFYTRLFYKIYGLKTISLRYFNVFGKRQNPYSVYSAVIPLFLKNIMTNKPITIYGDGNQSRDFTYVDNVVYANFLAMVCENDNIFGNYYNVGCGETTRLNGILQLLEEKLKKKIKILYKEERKGDVKTSLASLIKIKESMGYEPVKKFNAGLDDLVGLCILS